MPKSLKNTVFSFRMNNFKDLEKIKKIKYLAAIVMEVQGKGAKFKIFIRN